MRYINLSEMAAMLEGFAKTEVRVQLVNGVTVTTIYAGKPGVKDPSASTDDLECWNIRRTVITEGGSKAPETIAKVITSIVETWAEGAWSDRLNLTYQYL